MDIIIRGTPTHKYRNPIEQRTSSVRTIIVKPLCNNFKLFHSRFVGLLFSNNQKAKHIKTIKFIVSAIIGVIATLVLLAEIDINPLAFYAIKLSCIAVAYVCVRVMCEQKIIDLDD